MRRRDLRFDFVSSIKVAPRSDSLVKGSVTIAGHRTSLSLEPLFWTALRTAAVARGMALNALVAEIDEARTTNLSSAVRVWLFARALERGSEDLGEDD